MPVAIPLIGLAVSAGMGGLQMAKANKEKKAAQKAIEGYKRQDLVNPANGLQVSTLGADRQREDLARTMASYGNLAAMGGSRAIAGLLPNLVSQQNSQEAQIAAGLDEQQARIEQMKAQGQMGVQQMQEQREVNDLAGLGTQLNVANQNAQMGLNTISQGIGAFGNAFASGLLTSPNSPTAYQSNSNLVNNLSSRLPNGSALTLPNTVLPNNNAFSFGNNINGFGWSNLNIPKL